MKSIARPPRRNPRCLQAMQERTVTIDRETHALSDDFTVFATQNPIEYEGTYPLPEAQKDRFLLKIPMAAPEREDEWSWRSACLADCAPEASLERGDVRAVLGRRRTGEARARRWRDVSMRDEDGRVHRRYRAADANA